MPVDLFALVRKGDWQTLELQLNASNINQQDDNGHGLLHEAIAFRQDDIAIGLIDLHADTNVSDRNGKTPLIYAAEYQNKRIADRLIQAGADVNWCDKLGNGPAWHALQSSRKNYNIFEFLVENGANPGSKNKAGRSPADFAEQTKNEALIAIIRHHQRE